ncbi:MAG: radical SAM protein [Ruminococcus flavefaciens]|nr:radical SAM protein [Ruminococcus flavefaciens]
MSNTLQLLQQEIPKLKNKIESVQLCFTTDPFMYEYEEIAKMSLNAIEVLNNANIKCTVLTKGILPIKLAEYSRDNEYGITLISLDESYRKEMEPHAATYQARLEAMKALHDAGCKTWVSIEPYPTPNLIDQKLDELLETISFTDKIIFGRTNYCKEVSAYKQHKKFYNEQAKYVIEFCKKKNIYCHIKEKTITADE